ncbi:MAG: LPS export ABC transporter ATP-binding protein [Planctomycetes bacterium]|jgi:lipopolysaccharide export system ATP-binding protein|nr:LPS export ABC transporter ATP-binding protein [Planctomycetota bacterium]
MVLLEVESLTKSFRRRKAVDDVSFRVEPGEIVGLLGPNGAGKTTSFRMTVGMLRPDDGVVRFKGTDVTHAPMHRRARLGMGYLAQEASVFRGLSVEDNIMAVLETRRTERKEWGRLLEELLGELGLTRLRKSPAGVLSGGERRRLEITRTLVTRPALILLDEPFSGIDPIAVAEVQEIVLKLRNKGIGVLLTDHNVRETLSVTDRSYIIYQGRILRHGTSTELIEDELVRKIYLGEKFQMPGIG